MLNCIAVDDEPLALELLSDMINKIPFLNLKGSFDSCKKADQFLKKENIDLLFLDIQMPGIDGLELARKLDDSKMIIFTTAFDKYAVEGFSIAAVDYILKPIDPGRLSAAAEKALQLYKWKNTSIKDDFIFVNSQHKVLKIFLIDILYIEGLKDYVKIFLVNHEKPVLTRSNLKGMENILPPEIFKRAHKSYIVNDRKITARESSKLLLSGKEIPLGSAFKQNFK